LVVGLLDRFRKRRKLEVGLKKPTVEALQNDRETEALGHARKVLIEIDGDPGGKPN
jgi:hypothetical protein